MLKRLFKSIIDICRPGEDDASCAWGERAQKRPQKSVESHKPQGQSEPMLTEKKAT